jgi:hypothetical protein
VALIALASCVAVSVISRPLILVVLLLLVLCLHAYLCCYKCATDSTCVERLRCVHCLLTINNGKKRSQIKKFDKGGSVLRTMIHEEVVALDILRNKLFC